MFNTKVHSFIFRPNNFNMNSTCLSGCGCEGVPLYPVCDTQGTVYYSPCHAGCKLNAAAFTALDPKMTPTFNDCRCANTGNAVSRDFCEETDCSWKVVWYFLNMAISGVVCSFLGAFKYMTPKFIRFCK